VRGPFSYAEDAVGDLLVGDGADVDMAVELDEAVEPRSLLYGGKI